ncbi:hypothetical protein LXL04_023093 [Taraxacum kok-saghyz]
MASSSNHMRKKEVCNCKEEAPLLHVVDCEKSRQKVSWMSKFQAKDCKYFRWVDEEPTIKTYKDLLVKMDSDMKDMEDEMYLIVRTN